MHKYYYDKDKDYQELIDNADSYADKAIYEQQRNAKIDGEGLNAQKTYNYTKYLDKPYDNTVNYAEKLTQGMQSGNSNLGYMESLLNERNNKAENNPNYTPYMNDDVTRQAVAYIDSLRQQNGDYQYNKLTDALGRNEKPVYNNKWDAAMEEAVQKALNMNYTDYTNGSDYAVLKDRYTALGQKAMDDTLGKVAARTGGLASSYAVSAAQGQYNDYMSKLEDVARQMYANDRSDAINNANLAQGMADTYYGRYMDDLGQYNTDRTFVLNAYLNANNIANANAKSQLNKDKLNESKYEWEKSFDENVRQYDNNMAFNREQWDYGVNRDAKQDAQARINAMVANGASYDDIVRSSAFTSAGFDENEIRAMYNAATQNRNTEAIGGAINAALQGFSASNIKALYPNLDDATINSIISDAKTIIAASAKSSGGGGSGRSGSGSSSNEKVTSKDINSRAKKEVEGPNGITSTGVHYSDDIFNSNKKDGVSVGHLGFLTWAEVDELIEEGVVKVSYDANSKKYVYTEITNNRNKTDKEALKNTTKKK